MISLGDRIRIGLAPLHLLLGLALILQFARGPHTPMVLLMGLLLCAFGVHKLRLVRRALAAHKAGAQPPGEEAGR